MYPRLKNSALKKAESFFLYNFLKDEIYELDREGFELLRYFTGRNSLDSIAPGREGREVVDFLLSEDCLDDSYSPRSPSKFRVAENWRPSLRYLQMHITSRCNLDCSHCYLGEKEGEDMEIELGKRILDQFSGVGWKLLLTGGEPLQAENFWKLLAHASSKPLRIEVFTNATLLDEKKAESLSKYAHGVQVSLDGLKKGHEILRGEGSFYRAVEGIKAASRHLDVSIATMIHSQNIEEMPGLARFIEGLGVGSWSLDVPSLKGNLKENPHLMPDYSSAKQLYTAYGFSKEMHFGREDYSCGSHLMAVNEKGEISKCGFFGPLTDVKETSLLEGWKRVVESGVPTLEMLECSGCSKLEECRGGCRYRAEAAGSFLGRDPFMCELYR